MLIVFDDERITEEVLTELIYTAMCVPEHLVNPFLALSNMVAQNLKLEAIERSQAYAMYRHEQARA